ncbi:MAG: hypothetical protein H6739_34885 [Alphaproteobacteria bacterium]|nr:hypothetical protein [Alphaproteobacteria bacterium]
MINPLQAMARWRAEENALDSALSLFAAATAWGFAWKLLSTPTTGRPATEVELACVLGGCVAVTSWAMARHLYMIGRRRPRRIVFWSVVITCGVLFATRALIRYSFSSRCTEDMAGVLKTPAHWLGGSGIDQICVVNEVPGNPYLPGTLLEPAWSGDIPAWLAILLVAAAVTGANGLRDRRLRSSGIGAKLLDQLELAPAAGVESAIGKVPPDGEVVACGNPTLWGEICGQLYPANKKWEPGEWCRRCQQPFLAADRMLRFNVVSLWTSDIDVLNGLERLDTLSWPMGQPVPPDARVSGRERWITLGTLEMPDVISVAQALALAHARLEMWKGADDPMVKRAAQLARERASRICAWIWFGQVSHRMTYARPTQRARFALGAARLRDLVPEGGETLTLQLDVGLLPLELRLAFRRRFVDETRPDEVRNSKLDLWIPVSPPPAHKGEPGLWVDRIEGKALRAWLATDRMRPAGVRGVSTPLGYRPYSADAPMTELPVRPLGRLDFQRQPLDEDGEEPRSPTLPGVSVAEWDWFEPEQIELLRREALVLVETDAADEAAKEAV